MVPAAETADLMAALYAALGEGETVEAALWRAKTELRNRGLPKRYWAGWTLGQS